MKTHSILLKVAILICFVGHGPAFAQESILNNGGFEDGVMEPWGAYNCTAEVVTSCEGAVIPEGPVEGNYCLHVVVDNPGANFYDNGVYNTSYTFEAGKKYTLAAFFKSREGTENVNIKPERTSDFAGFNELQVTIDEEWKEYYTTTEVFASNVNNGQIVFHVGYAECEIWIDNVRFYEGDYVPAVIEINPNAKNPSPEDGTDDVALDVELSWTAGPFAATHDVYLGTDFNDVSNATVSDPLGVLVSQGQTGTTYVPENLLYGTTYYWRIDEVNAAPDNTIYKGTVWSFTTEPVLYPLDGSLITATASSAESAASGPERTIDGSGLNENDGHSFIDTDMWISVKPDNDPWIQYEFDDIYKLERMLVWNCNRGGESAIGWSLKEVQIETSLDGADWSVIDSISQLTQGIGIPGAGPTDDLDLGGAVAKYVRIKIINNWSSFIPDQFCLSEVRFYHSPLRARHPQPASGTYADDLAVELYWRPGRHAVSHELYVSDNSAAVTDSNVSALVAILSDNRYDLSSAGLEYNTTYYWKVVEVNEAGIPIRYEGPVWNFSTPEFLVLDDFEGYDDECDRIFFTWLDGLGHNGSIDCGVEPFAGNGTGSTVGNLDVPYAERTVVNSGRQALPIEYDNSASPYYSEAETADYALPDNWTMGGVDTLTLYVQGRSVPFAEPLPGTLVMNGVGADIYNQTDEFRFVYKELSGDGSMVARLDSVDDIHEYTKAGIMIRSGLLPRAVEVLVAGNPRDRVEWINRPGVGADTVSSATAVGATPFPHYLRLTRTGNTFTGEHSADGQTWETIGDLSTVDIDMPSPVYIGFVVCSHDSALVASAEFSEIVLSNNVGGPWQMAEIGVSQPVGNDPAPLYLAVEDSSGGTKVIEHPDADIVQSGSWQAWEIPLSEFSSIDLTSVKKVSLGVDNRNNPQAGGKGKLYIDDLRLKKR